MCYKFQWKIVVNLLGAFVWPSKWISVCACEWLWMCVYMCAMCMPFIISCTDIICIYHVTQRTLVWYCSSNTYGESTRFKMIKYTLFFLNINLFVALMLVLRKCIHQLVFMVVIIIMWYNVYKMGPSREHVKWEYSRCSCVRSFSLN